MVKTLELSVAMVALLGCLCSADTLHLKDGMSAARLASMVRSRLA